MSEEDDTGPSYSRRYDKLLRPAVLGAFEGKYIVRSCLVGDCCESCGKVFRMFKDEEEMKDASRWWSQSDHNGVLGEVRGEAFGNNDKGYRDYVCVRVCSAACAGKIMDGGWKKISAYADVAKRGPAMRWFALELTPWILEEAELLKAWDALPAKAPPDKYRQQIVGAERHLMYHGDRERFDELNWVVGCPPETWIRLLHALATGWWFGHFVNDRKRSRMLMWAKKPGQDLGKLYEVAASSAPNVVSDVSLGALLDKMGVPKVVESKS